MLTLDLHLANPQELVEFLKRYLLGEDHHQPSIIPSLNIYDFDPWDLPQLSWSSSDERERFYFSPLIAKSPGSNSVRKNRLTKTGSWQATGTEKPITDELTGQTIGSMRFYVHSHKENGVKWVMQEFKTTLNLPNEETLVLCKIMKKLYKIPKRTDKEANWTCNKTKIGTCDEGELSFNMDCNFEELNACQKTGLSTNNKDQKTYNNSTYNEGETGWLTNTAAENYVADVTIQEEVYADPVQHQQSFLCYNQQDYDHYALESFPYNALDTSETVFDNPFDGLPLWT